MIPTKLFLNIMSVVCSFVALSGVVQFNVFKFGLFSLLGYIFFRAAHSPRLD